MSALPTHAIPVGASERPGKDARHLRVVTAEDAARIAAQRRAGFAAVGADRWARLQAIPPEPRVEAQVAPLVLTEGGRIALRIAAGAAAVVLALVVGGLLGFALRGVPVAGESVVVGAGDTLWSIAAAERPASDVRDTIAQIVSLNGLESATVHPGQLLVLPAGD
ncbi:MAG TPA: LysM peptidoglycan-binding domain-containing protein [Actinomycetaceae bacterium]|nr:LysM peptidoglycan-binding domain-containing protein [Actinomycetaceae bacterium]